MSKYIYNVNTYSDIDDVKYSNKIKQAGVRTTIRWSINDEKPDNTVVYDKPKKDDKKEATVINGEDGVSSYTHYAYADSEDGTVNFNFVSGKYIGVYVDDKKGSSTNPARYTWNKIKGEKGDTGDVGERGVFNIKIDVVKDGSNWKVAYANATSYASSQSSRIAAIQAFWNEKLQSEYVSEKLGDALDATIYENGKANGVTGNYTYKWNGSVWEEFVAHIHGSILVDGSVDADKIQANSITLGKFTQDTRDHIDEQGTKATWSLITGSGKPADNANNTYIQNGQIKGVSQGDGTLVDNYQIDIIRTSDGGITLQNTGNTNVVKLQANDVGAVNPNLIRAPKDEVSSNVYGFFAWKVGVVGEDLMPGDTLTVSADLKVNQEAHDAGARSQVYIWADSWQYGAAGCFTTSTNWERKSCTYTLPDNIPEGKIVWVNVYHYPNDVTDGLVYVKRLKVERGAVATDYVEYKYDEWSKIKDDGKKPQDNANKTTFNPSTGKMSGVEGASEVLVDNEKIDIQKTAAGKIKLSGVGTSSEVQLTHTDVGADPEGAADIKAALAKNVTPGYSGIDPSVIYYDADEDAIVLKSPDGTTGIFFKAIKAHRDPQEVYKIKFRYRSRNTDHSSGFYCRVYWYNDELPNGCSFVGVADKLPNTAEATSSHYGFENQPISTAWRTLEFEYIPYIDEKYFSLCILNWTGIGTDEILIKDIEIERQYKNLVRNGEYFDDFDYRSANYHLFFSQWQSYSGSGEILSSNDNVSGGGVVVIGDNSGNDERRLIGKYNIPFDPSTLYKVTCRIKQPSGTGNLFLGVAGVKKDGVTFCNKDGDDTLSNQYYILHTASPASATWTTYVGYIYGKASVGDIVPHQNYRNPAALHNDVYYIRPLIYANHGGASGQVYVDSFAIEKVDKKALDDLDTKAYEYSSDAKDAARDNLAYRLGYSNYQDMVNAARANGHLIAQGGYLNVNLIETEAIKARHVDTDDLFAQNITATGTISGLNIVSGNYFRLGYNNDKIDQILKGKTTNERIVGDWITWYEGQGYYRHYYGASNYHVLDFHPFDKTGVTNKPPTAKCYISTDREQIASYKVFDKADSVDKLIQFRIYYHLPNHGESDGFNPDITYYNQIDVGSGSFTGWSARAVFRPKFDSTYQSDGQVFTNTTDLEIEIVKHVDYYDNGYYYRSFYINFYIKNNILISQYKDGDDFFRFFTGVFVYMDEGSNQLYIKNQSSTPPSTTNTGTTEILDCYLYEGIVQYEILD